MDKKQSGSKWAILVDDIGDIEADMIIAQLDSYNIKAKKYHKGDSQLFNVIMGALAYGVYVIVKKEELEDARKIIADFEKET